MKSATVIVGAGGQLGRALQATAPQDITVISLDRSALDIGDSQAIARMFARHRPRMLINAAAYTAVDLAESEPDLAHGINVLAARALARAAHESGAGFVQVSTDYVFDGDSARPYAPGAQTGPLNVYGRTKRDGEAAVRAAHADALILRSAWLHAAHGRNFVRSMLRLMATQREIRVVADQIGTPTRAQHLAAALWALIARGATGIHHFTDSGTASWYDFAVAIHEEALSCGILALPVKIVPIATQDFPRPAMRPAFSVLDKTGTWALLGGSAPHWREGLRATLRDSVAPTRPRERGSRPPAAIGDTAPVRFLIATRPVSGHFNPTVPVARQLLALGHEVTFATMTPLASRIESLGFPFIPLDLPAAITRPPVVDPMGGKFQIFDHLLQILPAMTRKLVDVVESFDPDAMLIDVTLLSAVLAAEKLAVPWASSSEFPGYHFPHPDYPPYCGKGLPTTGAGSGRAQWPRIQAMQREFSCQFDARYNAVRRQWGLPASEEWFRIGGVSPYLYLAYTVEELEYGRRLWPPQVHLVGPSIWDGAELAEAPAWLGEFGVDGEHPLIYVTIGTVQGSGAEGRGFFRKIVEAFGPTAC